MYCILYKKKMSLIQIPERPVRLAPPAKVGLNFAGQQHSIKQPSAKLSLNISAFNGNKTNFGRK
jgi:hypothetical protein